MRILMPIPPTDFDPSETAIPWSILTAAGHDIVFATPDGNPGRADQRMLDGNRLGPWRPLLRARKDARQLYQRMETTARFCDPVGWHELREADFGALVLPGGHAPGMKRYLESDVLQGVVADFFDADKPVGAICHGVVLAARSSKPSSQKSVLYGRKTTALTNVQERLAWVLTGLWLGTYYRTYPATVQDEVAAALAGPDDFMVGPPAVLRDGPDTLGRGFTVRDQNYLSARWPGDAYRFGTEFCQMLANP